MFKKILIATALVASSVSNAGLVQINGIIGSGPQDCTGLCASLAGPGLAVEATYDTEFAIAPSLEIFTNTGSLTFNNQMYAPNLETMPEALGGIPTPSSTTTLMTWGADLSSNADQVAVFGIGSTSGAPIWGIFDLVAGTFQSYVFSPDAISATGGILPLAAGTFTTSPIPVPAAAWLFLSGIAGLAGLKRAKK